jgi:hypothetical protein
MLQWVSFVTSNHQKHFISMKNHLCIAILLFSAMACKQNVEPVQVNQPVPVNIVTEKPSTTGSFTSGAHTTTGSVSVVIDSKDPTKKYLVFEGFKTDAGPDLRIYLAEDLRSTGFVEVTSTVTNGNFTLPIPTTANLDKQKNVLIWCKQFSVLFGSAVLK